MQRLTTLLTCFVILVASTSALADDAAPKSDTSAEADSMSFNVDLGYASSYVFRGLNVFGTDQLDQKMMVNPGLSMTLEDIGLTIGYWGAFQINGDNIGTNTDVGLGLEQDIYLGYSYALSDALSLSVDLFAYIYPFADEDASGASLPLWLEPVVGLTYSTVVDVGIKVSYMAGVTGELFDYSYTYINPFVGKSLELGDAFGLDLGLSLGYKVFNETPGELADNGFDVLVKVAGTWSVNDFLYVSPVIATGWTNFEALDVGDELFFFGGVNIGADL